jgi:hypothetical protein
MNWRGRPLTSFAAVIALIGATTTTVALTIRAALDERHYEKGIKMTDAAAESVQIERHPFHGEWNGCGSATDPGLCRFTRPA